MYRRIIKPAVDRIIGAVAFVVMLPIFLLCCLVLAFANRGKVFFVQQRPGRHERPFNLIKFKTMNDARDSAGNLLPDDQRLTAVGKFIRKTSLDEMPQLLNVISGAMSFVGPRPLLTQYLSLYNAHQRRRHEVTPGITGWAQINGRNSVDWQKRFDLDVWYVDHQSLYIDLKILVLTFFTVIKAQGIGDGSSPTMKNFEGN